MEKYINKVVSGDCLDIMRGIPSESVNAIITDPPYGIDYQSNARKGTKKLPKILNDQHPFIWWLYDANRILKDGGALICFCRWDVQEAFRSAIEWAGFDVKSQVIWDRVLYGMGDLKGAFAPSHDVIWFAVKGKFAFPNKRPKSVIVSQRVNGSSLTHPNEKPVDLMEQLIVSVTREGETVCDPFMGSGTTAIAALNTGRHFIGIEKDIKYVELANERIDTYFKNKIA
jgi:site-specific DNA-methyltransferase (adenine-specific)